jgi:hypothetical protein
MSCLCTRCGLEGFGTKSRDSSRPNCRERSGAERTGSLQQAYRPRRSGRTVSLATAPRLRARGAAAAPSASMSDTIGRCGRGCDSARTDRMLLRRRSPHYPQLLAWDVRARMPHELHCSACAVVPKDVSEPCSPNCWIQENDPFTRRTRGREEQPLVRGASRDGLMASPSPPDLVASASLHPSIGPLWDVVHLVRLFLSFFPPLAHRRRWIHDSIPLLSFAVGPAATFPVHLSIGLSLSRMLTHRSFCGSRGRPSTCGTRRRTRDVCPSTRGAGRTPHCLVTSVQSQWAEGMRGPGCSCNWAMVGGSQFPMVAGTRKTTAVDAELNRPSSV